MSACSLKGELPTRYSILNEAAKRRITCLAYFYFFSPFQGGVTRTGTLDLAGRKARNRHEDVVAEGEDALKSGVGQRSPQVILKEITH
ncbi:hypothetical protein SKAU_G00002130 [Synaphobranchus kaupii]|uniref:Uncharacterized protein n=1 Tax=Synaphobranchus kaupii TaxID=118154 RepID=A0A9Q1G9C8_SYNKA|nr:hypothetical protein SKAU_G00002130 [Synaphobranchus kaupii]